MQKVADGHERAVIGWAASTAGAGRDHGEDAAATVVVGDVVVVVVVP
jgi:hypothetical protein